MGAALIMVAVLAGFRARPADARARHARSGVRAGGAEPDADSPYAPPDIEMADLAEAIERQEGIVLPDALRQEFLDTDAEQFALLMEAGSGVADAGRSCPRSPSRCS